MTRQCPWPSGLHKYRAGKCERCGAYGIPAPVLARTASAAEEWAQIARCTASGESYDGESVYWLDTPMDGRGLYARTASEGANGSVRGVVTLREALLMDCASDALCYDMGCGSLRVHSAHGA